MNLTHRKITALLTVLFVIVIVAGCGRQEETANTASSGEPGNISADTESGQPSAANPAETTDSENDVTTVTIANPFVAATDSEIRAALDIPMDTSRISGVSDVFIVGGTFAQVDFILTDVNANEVTWTLRATRSEDEAENLHGLYYEDFSEPVILGNAEDGAEITYRTCGEDKWHIYSWNNDGIYYTLTHDGEAVSQMQTAAVLDEVLAAAGITE